MSHVTRIKTLITSRDHLKKALTDLGCAYKEGKFFITAGTDREEVEILLETKLPSSQIGFLNTDQGWIVAANLAGQLEVKRAELHERLSQRYAYNMVREKLEEQGFRVDEEVTERGSKQIHLVLRRTA